MYRSLYLVVVCLCDEVGYTFDTLGLLSLFEYAVPQRYLVSVVGPQALTLSNQATITFARKPLADFTLDRSSHKPLVVIKHALFLFRPSYG